MDLVFIPGITLSWRRVSGLKRGIQITGPEGNLPVATISWPGLFGRDATADAGGRQYRLDAQGLGSRRVVIQQDNRPVGELRLGFFGDGELLLADGTHFPFRRTGFLPPERTFMASWGSPLLRFKPSFFGGRFAGDIVVEPAASGTREAPLLAVLGVFEAVLRSRRAAKS